MSEEILGGIADWLHENGVKTNFDIAYENWRLETGLPTFERKSHQHNYLGIYPIGDKPANFCWIEGDKLLLREVMYTYNLGEQESFFYLMMCIDASMSFELGDPVFLDILLSAVR